MDAYMCGDRRMSVLPVGISLMTSCLSGLTLLGSSAEFYYQGPSYMFVALPMLLSGPITAWTMLPVFHRMNTLSLYKVSGFAPFGPSWLPTAAAAANQARS